MNHAEAADTGAVERYLLGQLSASESEEFERHFFDCSKCARDLRAAAAFEENARAVFLEERPKEVPSGEEMSDLAEARPSVWAWLWRRPWAVAPVVATAVLACAVAYQMFIVIPGLRRQLSEALAPQAVTSNVLPPISRGESRALEVPSGGRFYAIYMDPAWGESFASYVCTVQDESGATKFSVRLPAPPVGKPIQILMARSLLPSGRYAVVISNAAEDGKPQAELARYSLVLKLD